MPNQSSIHSFVTCDSFPTGVCIVKLYGELKNWRKIWQNLGLRFTYLY